MKKFQKHFKTFGGLGDIRAAVWLVLDVDGRMAMTDFVAPKGKILNKPLCSKNQYCHSAHFSKRLFSFFPSNFSAFQQRNALLLNGLVITAKLFSVAGIAALLGLVVLVANEPSREISRASTDFSITSLSSRLKKAVHKVYEVDTEYLVDNSAMLYASVKDSLVNKAHASTAQKPRILDEQKTVYAPNVVDVSNIPASKTHLKPIDGNSYPSSNLVSRKLLQIIKKRGRKNIDQEGLAQKIINESKAANFDPLFVAAVIKSESAFDRLAVSSAGARGLMQILPSTGSFIAGLEGFESVMKHRLTDPNYNVKLGIRYLKYLEQLYKGNRMLVLTAYNWGPGRVQDAIEGRRKIPAEVMSYALRILRDHQEWINELIMAA